MYKVISFFTDLQDNNHPYNVGDTFPREGMTVTEKRYKELAGPHNAQGRPLIEKVEDPGTVELPFVENPTEGEDAPQESKDAPQEPKNAKSKR